VEITGGVGGLSAGGGGGGTLGVGGLVASLGGDGGGGDTGRGGSRTLTSETRFVGLFLIFMG